MNIYEFHELEKADLQLSPFELWAADVEHILGHDLDGDQTTDGYSLDFAFRAFQQGVTPDEYAVTVRLAQSRLNETREN
jgi:hypothetical protein